MFNPPTLLVDRVNAFLTWSTTATHAMNPREPARNWVVLGPDPERCRDLCKIASDELSMWLLLDAASLPLIVEDVIIEFDRRGLSGFFADDIPALPSRERVEAASVPRYDKVVKGLAKGEEVGHAILFVRLLSDPVWWVVDLTARQFDPELPFPYYWPITSIPG